MRRKDRRMEDRLELEQVLEQGQLITLCLMDGPEPYMVPLNYGYAEGKIYFHSAKAGRKVEVLAKNNQVKGLVVVDAELYKTADSDNLACSMSTRFKSVMLDGEAELISDPARCREAMLALLRHSGAGDLELPEDSLGAVNMYCVHIKSMAGKKKS